MRLSRSSTWKASCIVLVLQDPRWLQHMTSESLPSADPDDVHMLRATILAPSWRTALNAAHFRASRSCPPQTLSTRRASKSCYECGFSVHSPPRPRHALSTFSRLQKPFPSTRFMVRWTRAGANGAETRSWTPCRSPTQTTARSPVRTKLSDRATRKREKGPNFPSMKVHGSLPSWAQSGPLQQFFVSAEIAACHSNSC